MKYIVLGLLVVLLGVGVAMWYRRPSSAATADHPSDRRRQDRRQRTARESAFLQELVERGEATGEIRVRRAMAAHHCERLAGIAVMLEGLVEELGELDDSERRQRVGLLLRHVRLLMADDPLKGVPGAGPQDDVVALSDIIREAARGMTRAGTTGILDLQLGVAGRDWVQCDRAAIRATLETLFGLCARSRGVSEERILVRLGNGHAASPFRGEALEGLVITIVVPNHLELLGGDEKMGHAPVDLGCLSPWRAAAGVIFAHTGDLSIEHTSDARSVIRIFLHTVSAPDWAGRSRVERGPAHVAVRDVAARWVIEAALGREGFLVTMALHDTEVRKGAVLVADAGHPTWRSLSEGAHGLMVMDGNDPPPHLSPGTLMVRRPFSVDDATRLARALALQYDAS